MPKIEIDGRLVDITQEQLDAWTQSGIAGREAPAGGSTLQLNDNPVILEPNTSQAIPSQTLAFRQELLNRNQELAGQDLGYGTPYTQTVPPTEVVPSPAAADGTGYVPPENDFIGRVAVGQEPGVSSYTPVQPANETAQPFELNVQTIDLVSDPNQGFVPYRPEAQPEPYTPRLAGIQTGPLNFSQVDDNAPTAYYVTQRTDTNTIAPAIQNTGVDPRLGASQGDLNVINRDPVTPVFDYTNAADQARLAQAQSESATAFQNGRTAPAVPVGTPFTNAPIEEPIVGDANPNAGGADATSDAAFTNLAQQQQAIRSQRSGFNEKDWRVRLALAPQAQYLYNVARPGDLLWPLAGKGVIFPYTPTIQTAYRANYQSYDLTHSNMRGYFYQSSSPQDIQITGTFTAQDTAEANYLLAVIHFLKSATKMFYGQDSQNGAPPPPLYLSGFGTYQFREHPVLLSSFNLNLPNDVDYIRAGSININGTDLVVRRDRTPSPPNTSPIFSAITRLQTIFTPKGAEPKQKAAQPFDVSGQSVELGGENPTYVPTQMEIQLTLLPLQSRSQMTKQFSLTQFAQGSLLKGGFW